MIAPDSDAANVRYRGKPVVGSIEHIGHHHRDPAGLQSIGRERRDVPSLVQRDGLAIVEHAGVRLGNEVKPFHVIFRAIVRTLFTTEQLQTRIKEMAVQINEDHPDGGSLHFVAVLKGAFVFLSDLARAMAPRPVTLDFIAVSSYGAATKTSGEVRLLKDLDTPLQGRDVIIVEDIVDTGLTLHYLQDVLRARDPKSLKTACLLSKPSRRKVDVAVEYIGFEIEDQFVVGYGLDHAGQFRHLPFIGIQE
jgi:hypoxanthine phosphoribosyltransferase